MTALKLTKSELRAQQNRLVQLRTYLPTLQLKKSLLQYEVNSLQMEITMLSESFTHLKNKIEPYSFVLLDQTRINLRDFITIRQVKKRYENIAGVEIPSFEDVIFNDPEYFLFDTPIWTEVAIEQFRSLVVLREKLSVSEEKMRALQKELREVSIRVNLFEKILIPRSMENIKKIRIFLSDLQLAAVAQAKIGKTKILARKKIA